MNVKAFLLLICCFVVQSLHAQKQYAPNYVVTHEKDTLVVDAISYFDSQWKDLMFTLTLPNGGRQKLSGSKVWRFKETRGGEVRFYQVARIQGKKRINHKVMYLAISGKLDLLYDRSAGSTDLFVTGKGFNDMITRFQGFKQLKALFDECEFFRKTHTDRKSRKFKNLDKMIMFYNQNCGGA